MNVYEQMRGETGREGMKNYVYAVQVYVEKATEMVVRMVKGMEEGDSKGISHMERAIQSLKDAGGYLEEAMREIEGE